MVVCKALLLVFTVLAAPLAAHGGMYRGPFTGVPGAGPTTPGGGLSPGSNPTTGPTGTNDPTRWQLWWELNRDPYLRRLPGELQSDGKRVGEPVDDTLARDSIVPALARALAATSNRDVTTSCLVALAKIDVDHPDIDVLDLMRQRLRRGNQEIRETAALSLGISGRVNALDDLIALVQDAPAGRRLMDEEHVDDRTRAFAAYGLGLLAQAHDDVDLSARVFAALSPLLAKGREDDRDVLVAVLNALKLLHPDPDASADGKRLLWQCLAALEGYLAREVGPGEEMVQAHAPTAIARLLGRGDSPDHVRFGSWCSDLLRHEGDHAHALAQSAALALGEMAPPPESGETAAAWSETLAWAAKEAQDVGVRNFAMIALGQIGGAANRDRLLQLFHDIHGPQQAWAALALGVLAHKTLGPVTPVGPAVTSAANTAGAADRDKIGEVLLLAVRNESNPDTRAAIAVALGLTRHRDAAPVLRGLLQRYHGSDELAGYLCIGLALMDDQEAVPLVESVLTESKFRPVTMVHAAMALARLQQRDAAVTLQKMLSRDAMIVVLAGAAQALGYIGDAASVPVLVAMLHDDTQAKLVHAFVAASLGMIADHDRLPWNARIAVGVNYGAATETLINGSSGVLDIL